jgi:hypothetical protein
MADGFWSSVSDAGKSFGLNGLLILGGFGLAGAAIYKGPDFKEQSTQHSVLIFGVGMGLLAVGIGLFLRWRDGAPSADETRTSGGCDVYIASPMAGYGADDGARKAAVDLVRTVEVSLRKLTLQNIYMPMAARPDAKDYETPALGFEAELAALRGAKRYLLVLPGAIPAGTSVLVTAGIAIALKMPCAVLAPKGVNLPYLLDGAVQSKSVQFLLHRYENAEDIKQLFVNNGLKLFGTESK